MLSIMWLEIILYIYIVEVAMICLRRSLREMEKLQAAAKFQNALLLIFLVIFVSELRGSLAGWTSATATFYGGSDASGTMGGACGYEDLYSDGYGVNNTALSQALFDDGAACGMCFQIVCNSAKTQWCKNGTHITVTATNYCPPNYDESSDDGGWCNPPRKHFDMSQPAWETIAIYRGGIVPVYYRRVRCRRSGGIRFTIDGNDYFELVLISNVGGSGVISAAWIKGSNTSWLTMSRNWGMKWQSTAYLNGQSLSFRLRTDDNRTKTAYDVAPASWSFGTTYTSSIQF